MLDFLDLTTEGKGAGDHPPCDRPKDSPILPRELEEVGRIMAAHPNIKGLEVLPYHNMGEKKYEELNISYPLKGMENLSQKEASRARTIILESFQRHRLPPHLSHDLMELNADPFNLSQNNLGAFFL